MGSKDASEKNTGSILDNPIYAKDMASKKKTCFNCWHFRNDHCALYSCSCASIGSGHPRWTSYEDGDWNERKLLSSIKLARP